MTFWRKAFGAGACVVMLACGSSEPDSPLILGGEKDAAPGLRTLTESQKQAMLNVIESAGAPCEAVVQTYLHDASDRTGIGLESWDVRCSHGSYAVRITDDGIPASVRRCPGGYGDAPCFQRDRGFQPDRDVRRPSDTLNPELGKLLEPMTAKGVKVD